MTQLTDSREALQAAALAAAARGWPVFPLRPGGKRPAGHAEDRCPGTGRCVDGHRKPEQRATTDPDLITRCWTSRPYNVGIATGPSGLVVVDLDTPKHAADMAPADWKGMPDGMAVFSALCERAGQAVPTTHTVRTGRGGWHLYFTAPPGIRLGGTAGALGWKVDTRAWGGYVVGAASSVRGRVYTVADAAPPVPLPVWLTAALAPAPRPRRPVAVSVATNAPAYAAAALRNETALVANAPEGTRNATLLRAARALGRLVASGDLARAEVEDALSRGAAAVGSESQRYYDDVINRALNWSIANNPTRRGPTA